ncbi:MAG: tRNA epoxyqueuosine(34) reductase QueG [Bdellovibrionales bacterium]
MKSKIRDAALKAGFDAVGFAPASLSDITRERLQEFLAKGLHGEMDWLANRAEQRGNPQALWPEAKSVICLGMNYGPDINPLTQLEDKTRGAISVYAQGDDYHDVLKKKQRALASWIATEFKCDVKIFVDTAPVMEKPLAQNAGLGWQGKHTNLVSRQHGSWLFLAEIFTTLDLEPDAAETDHCGNCRACLDVCPTQAFIAPYQLDARRCISYLTIEHKGPIPEDLRPLMGNRIYGCDDCTAVCPWNKFATPTDMAEFRPRAVNKTPPLAELAQLDDAAFRTRFSKSPIKRIGRDRFVRNVLIAIGNSGDKSLAPVAQRLANDLAFVVSDAAAWALKRLAN